MNRIHTLTAVALAMTAFSFPATAQVIGAGNTFNDATDEVRILRNGTANGSVTAASFAAYINGLVASASATVTSGAVVGSDIVLAMSDGSNITIVGAGADTDTFASIAGNVVTFADGSTFDLATLDDSAGVAANATAIAGNDTDIAALVTADAAQDTTIAANTTAAAAAQTSATTNATAITSLNTSQGTQDTAIAANATAIGAIDDTTTASNGLTLSTDDVQLGGALTAATEIDSAGFGLDIRRAGNKRIINEDGLGVSTRLVAGAINASIQATDGAEISRFLATTNGEVQINSSIGTYRFVPFGSGLKNVLAGDATTTLAGLNPDGSLRDVAIGPDLTMDATGTLQFTVPSDANKKTNVSDVSGALDRINALRPVTFEYKHDLGQKHYGFIAQEVQAVYPDYVMGEPMTQEQLDAYEAYSADPDMGSEPLGLGIRQGFTTADLVAAIQELSARLEALE